MSKFESSLRVSSRQEKWLGWRLPMGTNHLTADLSIRDLDSVRLLTCRAIARTKGPQVSIECLPIGILPSVLTHFVVFTTRQLTDFYKARSTVITPKELRSGCRRKSLSNFNMTLINLRTVFKSLERRKQKPLMRSKFFYFVEVLHDYPMASTKL